MHDPRQDWFLRNWQARIEPLPKTYRVQILSRSRKPRATLIGDDLEQLKARAKHFCWALNLHGAEIKEV